MASKSQIKLRNKLSKYIHPSPTPTAPQALTESETMDTETLARALPILLVMTRRATRVTLKSGPLAVL